MGPDFSEILEVCQNTNFEDFQNLFDITHKLVHKQGEILNARMIECASPSWTRSSLAQDQAIMWSKAKVRVCSDSVLWLGKMTDPADANRRWEGQMEEFQQTDSHRELFGIDGEPMSSSGIFSQDFRHWKSSEKSRKTCKNKTLNLKNLKTESSSCRCSMVLIGREEEIQKSVFQIPIKSRTTRRNSSRGTGHFLDLEAKRSGVENQITFLKENGKTQPT